MAGSTATIQMHHREAFERNVARALAAGAGAGVLHFLAYRASGFLAPLFGATAAQAFPAPDAAQLLPLTYVSIAGASIAAARGDKLDRLLLIALSVVLPAVPWLFGLSPGWTLALSAATAGGLMVRSHLCDRGEEGQVGGARPGLLNYALGASLTGGLAVAGTEVARALSTRLLDFATPLPILCVFAGMAVSLFVGLGSIAAHLALKPDPVEARCEELIPTLSGELKSLASRALSLYQQCGRSLAELPREPAREEMARTLSTMTREAVELAAEWSGLEAQLHGGALSDLHSQMEELTRSAAAAKDPIARKQLELAASALREEMVRLEELMTQRERIVAKLKAEVALLERARVVLIGMRSGQMQLKAAELSAIARRFNSLSSLQSAEARLADAMATNAELAQHEAAQREADLQAAPSPVVPVAPVAPDAAPEPVQPVKTPAK